VTIHADASIWSGLFDGDDKAVQPVPAGRKAYVHVVRGRAQVNGQALEAGDAIRIQNEHEVEIEKAEDAEILLFDLT
jgi:hypothetical protein